jgi:hypothetical protein
LTLTGTTLSATAGSFDIGSNASPLTSLSIKTEYNQIPVKIYGTTSTFTGAFRGPFTQRMAQRGTLDSPATIQDSEHKSFYKQSMIKAEVESKIVRKESKKKNVTVDEE